jgi:hypothetical protein
VAANTPGFTPYPDVNAVLQVLLANVKAILGDHLVGIYLYGSLASGDFDLQRSDIDFVVVTDNDLANETISALGEMHARIFASDLKWAPKLEGSYISRQALSRYDPNAAPCPTLNEGKYYVAPHGSDWIIQRSILRESGVVLAGPPLEILIEPVQAGEICEAVRGILREWWLPMLNHPDPRLHRSEYQAYAILTMCRALYTLEYKVVASKPVSARWAQEALGEPWGSLIKKAQAWYGDSEVSTLDETLDFMACVLNRSNLFPID